jgi:glycosyltransferase involved in cell wall biosynthesis
VLEFESASRWTVAVPTCDGAAHLSEALQSVLGQERVSFELVVSDDCSTDRTPEIVRAIAGGRARVQVNPRRLGLAGNWNRCVELCRTPLVAIFHQDDVMLPGHLAAHDQAFAADPRVGLVANAALVIDDRGSPLPETRIGAGGLGPADRVFAPGEFAPAAVKSGGNPLRCSAVTLRCEAFHDAGGFDASYHYVVDWEFWLRLSRRWRIAWLASPSIHVRWHPASETHRFQSGTGDLEETSRLMDDLFAVDLTGRDDIESLRRAANRRLARAFLNRAHDALRAGQTTVAGGALRRGLRLSPGVVGTILRDPRLAVSMGTLAAAPRVAAWLFGSRRPNEGAPT